MSYSDPADEVEDTPPQAFYSTGCPIGQDSCPGGGIDDVRNYMDYGDDPCKNHFTKLVGLFICLCSIVRVKGVAATKVFILQI